MNSSKWVVNDGVICINSDNCVTPSSALDIIRAEYKSADFKPYKLNRPSTDLPYITFHRFPLRISVKLTLFENNSCSPTLTLVAQLNSKAISLQRIPNSDQVVIDNNWFSIDDDSVKEVIALTDEYHISQFGNVTLRTALDLIRSRNDILEIESSTNCTPESTVDDVVRTQLEQLKTYNFIADLYDYQKVGFSWLCNLVNQNIGCVLADEMGLGKTIQLIAIITYFKPIWNLPNLVVAPATILENWKREINRFSPELEIIVHAGSKRTGFPSKIKKQDVIITSYDTVIRDQSLFNMINWGIVILDEAQAIKNPDTFRSRAVKNLNRLTSIAVTGTPIENKLLDLWSIFDFAIQDYLGERDQFINNYSDNIDSASKLELLISPLMLRRKVEDVAADLPKKIIINQPINMDKGETEAYEYLKNQIREKFPNNATLASIVVLRQYCTHPIILSENYSLISTTDCSKFNRLLQIIEEISSLQEKVLIFTSFTKMCDLIKSSISKTSNSYCEIIDGRTPVENRQQIVDSFAVAKGFSALILNPRAAGTGINITSANHVIHYNLEWNPAIEDQATARAYRRGQELPVFVHRLYYPNTVDEVILDRIERKRTLSDIAVVGTTGADNDSIDLMKVLDLSPSESY